MDKCDLHIHSSFSDSDTGVEEVFKQAKAQSLRCIAIADHDSVDGITQAEVLSQSYGIELIPAIELSARQGDNEVHILGYFIDHNNRKLKDALAGMKELREERLLFMVDKLNSLGVEVDKNELLFKVKEAILKN